MKHVRRSVFFGLATLVALPFLPVEETLVNEVVSRIPKTVDVKIGEAMFYLMGEIGLPLLPPLRLSRNARNLASVDARVNRALATVYPGINPEPLKLKIHTIDAGDPTAFAIPGGRVFVSGPLLDLLTHNELTAVVAHEVAHVILRHGVKQMVHHLLFSLLFEAALRPDADGDDLSNNK